RSEAIKEKERLKGEREKARDKSRRVKEDKEKLESNVTLLHERCNGLSHRVSLNAVYNAPISSGLKASEDLLNSRWSQIFPGAAVDQVASSTMRTSSAYSTYTPVSEQSTSLRSMQNSAEIDGQRLQGMIDSNKRWLETQKKDPSIPLLTPYQAPSSKRSLVQLGMDDTNQIRVYHY
ncbi:unnamed protein product, partial [Pleuronectes platessa]